MMKLVRIKMFFLLSLAMVLFYGNLSAQTVIDQVVAVVGDEMIMLSDIEQEAMRQKMQGYTSEGDIKCEILEQLMIQKLLLDQAKIDSLTTNEIGVEREVEQRLRYFLSQMGNEAALEKYFNKAMYEIRSDLRDIIRQQQLTEQMRSKIVENVKVTPSEISKLFKTIPSDSLPIIPEQYMLKQIMINPPAATDAKFLVKEKLLELRQRILNGERFSTLAVIYSEDRGSAAKGGELGFRSREELVKSFADAAFNLKEGQVSSIVESEYGFHIIQMIEKRDNQVNVRHILMKPTYTTEMTAAAQQKLDSIANLIKLDSLTFEGAALRFSEDKKTRLNGGIMVNPQSGTSLFQKDQLAPADYYVIKELKKGEMSRPFESRDEHANVVFKLVKIEDIIPSHKASLEQDYSIIQNLAKREKENEIFMKWLEKKKKQTFIRIDPSFRGCKFSSEGWIK